MSVLQGDYNGNDCTYYESEDDLYMVDLSVFVQNVASYFGYVFVCWVQGVIYSKVECSGGIYYVLQLIVVIWPGLDLYCQIS